MGRTKGKPGVMLYFELCDTLQLMSQAEKGDLLDAILAYGKSGVEPDFADRAMAMIWSRLRFDIQRDDERYEEIRARRSAAANKRWHPEEVQEDANASDAMQMMPTTTTTTTSAPATAATTTPAAAATPTAAAAPTSYSAAIAAADPTPGNSPPAPLRENGTHLPDCVAQYVPRRSQMPPEEFASQKERWKAALRALPDDTPKTPGPAVDGGPGVAAQRSLT